MAVITGGSAGVGRAVAIRLAREGHPLGLLARRAEGLERTEIAITELGGRALAIPTDVAEWELVEAAADRIEAELGPIGIWINNAVVAVLSPFAAMRPDELERVTRVTHLGIVNGTRTALARMRPRDRGTIVQIGSALACQAIPLQSAYCGAELAAVRPPRRRITPGAAPPIPQSPASPIPASPGPARG